MVHAFVLVVLLGTGETMKQLPNQLVSQQTIPMIEKLQV